VGSTLGLAGGGSKISTSKEETEAAHVFKREGRREGRKEGTWWLRTELVGDEFGQSNLIKYPSGIRVNPILKEVDPLVHCGIPNETKGSTQPGSNLNVGGETVTSWI
jgi:hypothetical protein